MKKVTTVFLILVLFASLPYLSQGLTSNCKVSDAFTQVNHNVGISKVNLLGSIYFLFTNVNISIEYIQLTDNGTFVIDNIEIKGNLSNVEVTDQLDSDLLIGLKYNETSGYTKITYQLPKVLSVGEKYTIQIYSILPTESSEGLRELDLSVSWSRAVSVFSSTIYLEKNLILYSTNPQPQTLSVIDGRLRMTWDTINLENFNLIVEYKSGLTQQIIEVSPSSWHVGRISRSNNKIIQSFTVTNLLTVPIKVNITDNLEIVDTPSDFEINSLSFTLIDIEIDISKDGEFEGQITFQTNVSINEIDIPVSLTVYSSTSSWTYFVIIFSVFAVALGLREYRRYLKSRNMKQATSQGKQTIQVENILLDKLQGILSEKELQVMNEILKNPEISQSQVASRTKIPKATLSRIIQRLENKRLIIKTSVGMSNKLSVNRDSPVFKV